LVGVGTLLRKGGAGGCEKERHQREKNEQGRVVVKKKDIKEKRMNRGEWL
jgi:hypothetical protein